MTRVQSVVGRSIMVHIHDVVENDILYTFGNEFDPVIERVERDGDRVRFHYKPRPQTESQKKLGIVPVLSSNWMDPNSGDWYRSARVFIHDLRNERAAFEGDTNSAHRAFIDIIEGIN